MHQTSLFDAPIARSTDPESSHLAGNALTHSGARADQKAMCLDAVKAHPGKTSLELAELTGICRYVLARRLSDLQNNNLAHKGALVRCTVSGNLAAPWWLGPDPMNAIASLPTAAAA